MDSLIYDIVNKIIAAIFTAKMVPEGYNAAYFVRKYKEVLDEVNRNA